jgi:hypothetical protein
MRSALAAVSVVFAGVAVAGLVGVSPARASPSASEQQLADRFAPVMRLKATTWLTAGLILIVAGIVVGKIGRVFARR